MARARMLAASLFLLAGSAPGAADAGVQEPPEQDDCAANTTFLLQHRAALVAGEPASASDEPVCDHPGHSPPPETLAPGFSYSEPEGSGCGDRPAWTESAPADTPAAQFSVDGWSGFCQTGWSLCPDAIANRDYMYYAKGLNLACITMNNGTDKEYCRKNGFLEPEIASIVTSFTAMQARAESLCATKYNTTLQQTCTTDFQSTGVAEEQDLDLSEEDANKGAIWNCAMGDLGCDIAYCNYFYCLRADGSVGFMDECEGFDRVNGMPATRAS